MTLKGFDQGGSMIRFVCWKEYFKVNETYMFLLYTLSASGILDIYQHPVK